MRTAALALLVLVVAGCGGIAPGASPPLTAPPPSTHAAPGPFRVRVTRCGKFTRAEQVALGVAGTNATSGLIATVTNTGTYPAEVQLSVNFTDDGMVQDNNTSGFTPLLNPGQSAIISVDNVYGAGQAGNPADTCEPVNYAVQTAAATLAGTWPLI